MNPVTFRCACLLTTVLAAAAGALPSVAAELTVQTVLDGVYDTSQARRGAREYRRHCAECHEGAEPDGDPLMGPVFVERWREAPLSFLYGFMSSEMPGNDPGSLDHDVYIDVLAFLLSANQYPAGKTLTPAVLDQVLFTAEEGPQPLPLNSLVQVSGCLVQDADETWTLDKASPPVRVRSADNSTAVGLAMATGVGTGTARYRLGMPRANTPHAGAHVQVQGVLVAHGPLTELTALSVAATGAHCP